MSKEQANEKQGEPTVVRVEHYWLRHNHVACWRFTILSNSTVIGEYANDDHGWLPARLSLVEVLAMPDVERYYPDAEVKPEAKPDPVSAPELDVGTAMAKGMVGEAYGDSKWVILKGVGGEYTIEVGAYISRRDSCERIRSIIAAGINEAANHATKNAVAHIERSLVEAAVLTMREKCARVVEAQWTGTDDERVFQAVLAACIRACHAEPSQPANPPTPEAAADRPTIVCLCGSTRFSEAFRAANLRETLAGKIVLSIGCDFKSDDGLKLTSANKVRLDELHLRKIDLADEVLILNVGGYIGESTRREFLYAEGQNKKIRFLEPSLLPVATPMPVFTPTPPTLPAKVEAWYATLFIPEDVSKAIVDVQLHCNTHTFADPLRCLRPAFLAVAEAAREEQRGKLDRLNNQLLRMTAERNEYRFEAQRARIDERKRIAEWLRQRARSLNILAEQVGVPDLLAKFADEIEAGTL